MRRLLLLLFAFVSTAFPWLKSYDVPPTLAAYSGKVDGDPQYGGVGQTFVANFDSVCYCELFVGYLGQSPQNKFRVEIWEDDGPLVARKYDVDPPDRGHKWLRFDLEPVSGQKFVRGKTYIVKFTRPGDSIHYYDDIGSAYPYGHMVVGGQDHNSLDLCMRVYAQLDPIDSTFWGMNPEFPWDYDTNELPIWVERAESAGVGMMRVDERWFSSESTDTGDYNWKRLDTQLMFIDSSAGCGVMLLVYGVPKWASTRFQWYDSSSDTSRSRQMYLDTCVYCPPRGLWANPDSGETNYWARYLGALVDRIDERGWRVHDWEIGNETNEGCTLWCCFPDSWPGYTGWWRPPNDDSSYPGVTPSAHDMCSLYVRLCQVAADTIRSDTDHANDRIIIGAVSRVNEALPEYSKVMGKAWVDTCYRVATRPGGPGVFWDGVSVHPYQFGDEFDSDMFYSDAETLRAIMKSRHDDGVLWNTELGWDLEGASSPAESLAARNAAARNLCKTFVSAKASEALPGARYDRTFWWLFAAKSPTSTCPLVEKGDGWPRYPSFYACKQASSLLDGKRFNQRVLSGDAGLDTTVRMYEFTDTSESLRQWVCWRDKGTVSVEVRLPVRADTAYTDTLDCDSIANVPIAVGAGMDGWFSVTLDSWPMFIREGEEWEISRPDIVVDSVKYVPADELPGPESRLTAWITNHGNRATPVGGDPPQPYSTWVVFKRDTATVGEAEYSLVIEQNQQVSVGIKFEEERVGSRLYSAKANPDQLYVERYGLDDNAGYLLKE